MGVSDAEDSREGAPYVVLELEGEGFKVGDVSEVVVQVMCCDVAEWEGAKEVEVDDGCAEVGAFGETLEGIQEARREVAGDGITSV